MLTDHASRALWAKTTGSGFYPLLAHLLDTAAAARHLVDAWLPQPLLARLEDLLDGDDPRDLIVAAAGLHDLGKATPGFATQRYAARSDTFTDRRGELDAAGLPLLETEPPALEVDQTLLRRHEVASGVWLAGGLDSLLGSVLSATVTGHHGVWRAAADRSSCPVASRHYTALLADPAWRRVTDALRDTVLAATGATLPQEGGRQPFTAVPLLTGVVVLADWLASSESAVAAGVDCAIDPVEEPAAFYEQRREWLAKHASELLGTPRKPVGGFQQVFGFPADTPVQQELVRQRPRGLSVVMAPMGEGKTEAALGYWMENAAEHQGLYFALPTMATADAMLGRVSAFFEHTEDPVLGSLAHGRAVLNSFYQPGRDETFSVDHGASCQGGGLAAGSWFTGRHRPLLAPVSVGTVDQLLSGVLRHRYNFLRTLGAATKTVVLDEVHSYDAYMDELLVRFLEWAGALHLDVLLLSATLPRRRLARYLKAYQKGQGHPSTGEAAIGEDVPYPAVASVATDGDVTVTPLAASGQRRRVTVNATYTPTDDTTAAVAAELADVRQTWPDAKITVICNTVRTAQEVAQAAIDAGEAPLVAHARLPAAVRADRISEALTRFGRNVEPGADLMVATQIAEQSLDIDADVLITELAPAPSLLQRLGRLWRHERRRPPGLEPTVRIVHPGSPGASPWGSLPYSGAEVAATFQRSLEHGTLQQIQLPEMMQQLVDAGDVSFADVEATDPAYATAAETHLVAEAVTGEQAKRVAVPTPSRLAKRRQETYLSEYARGELGQEETATRWSQLPTATLLLVGQEAGAWSGPLPTEPTRDDVIALLGCTVPVSGRLASSAARAAYDGGPVRHSQWRHQLLHDLIVVDLDAAEQLDLDPTLGLLDRPTSKM